MPAKLAEESTELDFRASILYHFKARGFCLGRSLSIADTKLHPYDLCSDLYGLISNRSRSLRISEHINHVDWNRDGLQVAVHKLTQDMLAYRRGVYGNDSIAFRLEVFHCKERRSVPIWRCSDHSDRPSISKNRLYVRIIILQWFELCLLLRSWRRQRRLKNLLTTAHSCN